MAHRNVDPMYIERPFGGLPGEPGWVAMRELIPSAVAVARTTSEHGNREVFIVTALPDGAAALHRPDGQVFLALQSSGASDDLSADLAAALLAALESAPGTAIVPQHAAEGAPRLQDILQLDQEFEPEVRSDYEYWLDPNTVQTPEVKDALATAAQAIIPMAAVAGVPFAYWAEMNNRFLRWVRPEDEDDVVAGLARLQARRASAIPLPAGDAKFLGMFRAAGLTIPVWQLPPTTTADDLAEPLAEFAVGLEAALAAGEPLTAEERRARAGIFSRQVTLR